MVEARDVAQDFCEAFPTIQITHQKVKILKKIHRQIWKLEGLDGGHCKIGTQTRGHFVIFIMEILRNL